MHTPTRCPTILTEAEHEVARLWAAGLTCTAIAERCGTTSRCVSTQLARACAKLGIERDRRALALALPTAEIGWRRGRIAGRAVGWTKGEPLRLVGGRYVGRTGAFVRFEGVRQVAVRIGGGVVAVLRTNVQREAA